VCVCVCVCVCVRACVRVRACVGACENVCARAIVSTAQRAALTLADKDNTQVRTHEWI